MKFKDLLIWPFGKGQPLGEKKDEDYPSYPNIHYPTPQETEAGAAAIPTLKARASGQGVAFSPEQLTMYGQPYAQAATNQWENYAKPNIEEAWASKGLGRSTMAGQAEVQGQKDLADIIGTNWSDLNKWNETLKQAGITGGLAGLQDYMQSELSQGNKNAEVPLGKYSADLGQYQYQQAQPTGWDNLLSGVGTGAGIYSNIMSAMNPQTNQWDFLKTVLGNNQNTTAQTNATRSIAPDNYYLSNAAKVKQKQWWQ